MPARSPKKGPRGSQDGPKRPQEGPKTTPTAAQDSLMTAHDSPRRPPSHQRAARGFLMILFHFRCCSKFAPTWFQEGTHGPKKAQVGPNRAQVRLKLGPRWPQEGPKRAPRGPQEGPKRAPRGPKRAPRGPQASLLPSPFVGRPRAAIQIGVSD